MKIFPYSDEVNDRIFYILISTALFLSVVLTVETMVLGFAFHHNIKWLVMMVLSTVSYWFYRQKKYRRRIQHVFFVMLMFILLPVGWLYSPVYSPFPIAYAFILASAVCFFFDGVPRVIYITGLSIVCTVMMLVEHFIPKFFPVMADSQRIIDIVIQMPLTLIVLSTMLMAFANTLRKKNQKLDQLSKTDELTGLYNRRFIYHYMETELSSSNESCYVGILDIDNFKSINDSNGHNAGDKTIQFIAEHFLKLTEDKGIVGRLGGDEFIVILKVPKTTLESIVGKLNNPIAVKLGDDTVIDVTISGGFSRIIDHNHIDEVMTSADKKLYQSKKSGKAKVIY